MAGMKTWRLSRSLGVVTTVLSGVGTDGEDKSARLGSTS